MNNCPQKTLSMSRRQCIKPYACSPLRPTRFQLPDKLLADGARTADCRVAWQPCVRGQVRRASKLLQPFVISQNCNFQNYILAAGKRRQ